jgi:hypothetical protein
MVFCVYVGNDCGAKRAMGYHALFLRVSQAKAVERLTAEWAVKDPNMTAEQIFVKKKMVKQHDGSEREVDVSLAEMKMELGDLQDYLGECSHCKANVASDRFKGGINSGFGCFLELPLPLAKGFEQALIVGARNAVEFKSVDPAIAFLDHMTKTKVSGATMARMRKGEDRTFESTEPLSFSYGGFLSKRTITTDQILEMLLAEKTEPHNTLLYHHFLENTERALETSQEHSSEIKFQFKAMSAIFAVATELRVPVYAAMRPD